MKNQYFGDVNDYQKYGLLRTLSSNSQYKIGVCWMLTADDGRTDGKFINYLSAPQRWRRYDPSLYDILQKWVIADGARNVALAESSQVLPDAEFYSELLIDSLSHRAAYFQHAREKLANCDLIFYDPDTGIEAKSTTKGRRNSAKYIYWDEVGETFAAGQSLLVYQHFPHEERTSYIRRIAGEYQARLKANKVYWFRTPQVVYFLSVQEKHVDLIAPQVRLVVEQWGNQILTDYR